MSRHASRRLLTAGLAVALAGLATRPPAAEFTPTEAAAAMRRATEFFRSRCAVEGGYVWKYSADLSKREGEQATSSTQVWTQPPSTSSVGLAYLEIHQLTGDEWHLAAARETAECLIRGQLHSGGWDKLIDFDPEKRRRIAYRVDPPEGKVPPLFNTTTLDDDKTQSGIVFLMRLDAATGFRDPRLHEAALYAVDGLVKAQRANGGWPQRFAGPSDPEKYPALKASFPKTWSRTFPDADFTGHYTFNDDNIARAIDVLLEAAETYAEPRFRAAAEKAGDFIRAAQLPEPQPAWAQQYDAAMHPTWARRFEPPSITGGESQGVIKALVVLSRTTGEKRFLEPIPPALAWMRRSLLPDGRLARFYELETNRPLYVTKAHELTYDPDDDLPAGYVLKVPVKIDRLQAAYEAARDLEQPVKFTPPPPARIAWSDDLARESRRVAEALDDRGAWVTDGRLRTYGPDDQTSRIIETGVFVKHALLLARAATAR